MTLDLSSESIADIGSRDLLSNDRSCASQLLVGTVHRRQIPSVTTSASHHLNAAQTSQLEALTGVTWSRCVFMGPLWDVELTSVDDMNAFQQTIQSEMRSHEDMAGRHIKVQCTPLDLCLESPPDNSGIHSIPSLLISVTTDGHNSQLLMCNESALFRFVPANHAAHCSWFSLVLTRGHRATVSLVLDRLRLVFGASLTDADFSQDQMMWMAALWSTLSLKRLRRNGHSDTADTAAFQDGNIAFSWCLPKHLAQSSMRVRADFAVSDMARIWHGIGLAEPGFLSRDEMTNFHQALETQLLKNVGVPVGQLVLVQLETPDVLIRSSGSFKFGGVDAVCRCVELLREFSREFFFGRN